MVEAAQTNKRIVQIGSQRVSSELCRKAREMYLQGAIGEIRMVELSLGRNSPNGAWVYPPPPDLSTGESRLEYLAQRHAQNSAGSASLRPVEMLERIWHRSRR